MFWLYEFWKESGFKNVILVTVKENANLISIRWDVQKANDGTCVTAYSLNGLEFFDQLNLSVLMQGIYYIELKASGRSRSRFGELQGVVNGSLFIEYGVD
jgi:hypothetical protein